MRDIIREQNGKVVVDPPQKDSVKSKEKPYRVIYMIDCHAKNPKEAALYVEGVLKDMDNRPDFQVIDSEGKITDVDLYNEVVPES